jgi:hypothetical protein
VAFEKHIFKSAVEMINLIKSVNINLWSLSRKFNCRANFFDRKY